MADDIRFSDAYADIRSSLATNDFSNDPGWASQLKSLRKIVGADGFDVSHAEAVADLRKLVRKAATLRTNEAACLFQGAGENLSGAGPAGMVDAKLAARLGALKTLHHTYLLKRFGGHKVWIVSIPTSFDAWPSFALAGGIGKAATLLADDNERFSADARKHLSDASQHGLRWVHKAMSVSSSPKSPKNFEKIARWFADSTSKDSDVIAAAGTLNAGLKKLTKVLSSGGLIYTDAVPLRNHKLAASEAFVFNASWKDSLDVVYIENEFFGNNNTLKGLTNWTRIVVHELTHRELDTDDHAYEWQGMAPRKIGAAKALTNADSWAWFCADCGGALTDGEIANALART